MGKFISKTKSIELPIELFLSQIEYKFREEFVSSNILHEAQHARLHRLGFGSDRDTLGRQERICYLVQRRFGEKLLHGPEVIEFCNYALSVDLERYYSTEAFLVRQFEQFESEDIPKWLKKYLMRKIMRKYKKLKNVKDESNIHPDLAKWNCYLDSL